MQTIWSRVAQTRGTCKCPQCLSYTKGVARRATASATRPVPKIWTSSTFLYSGIFAAAATWDANVKVERREQWDKVIGDLRRQVGQPVEVEKKEEAVVVDEVQEEMTDVVERSGMDAYRPFGLSSEEVIESCDHLDPLDQFLPLSDLASPTKTQKTISSGSMQDPASNLSQQLEGSHCQPSVDVFSHEDDMREEPVADKRLTNGSNDVFENCDPATRTPEWPTNTGPPRSAGRSPQSIYASDEQRQAGEALLWSDKKLLGVQASMELFLYRIFLNLRLRQGVEEAAASVPQEFADTMIQGYLEIKKKLQVLTRRVDTIRHLTRPEHFEAFHRDDRHVPEFCLYTQDRDLSHLITNRQLNTALRELFHLAFSKELPVPTLLAKVAYNLSISSAPPNVNTYNILLLGFMQLNEMRVAGTTIQSILESHIRPNEVTSAAMLDYYTKIDSPELFVHQLARMRGQRGGEMLARPTLRINETNRDTLVRHHNRSEKIIRLQSPTPYVLRAVVSGTLKFTGFKPTLKLVQNMHDSGWGIDIAGLIPLLYNCAERSDWAAGQAIWQKMLALKNMSRRREGDVVTTEKIGREGFVAMLKLCLRCEKKEWYEAVLRQVGRTMDVDREWILDRVRGKTVMDEVNMEDVVDARRDADAREHLATNRAARRDNGNELVTETQDWATTNIGTSLRTTITPKSARRDPKIPPPRPSPIKQDSLTLVESLEFMVGPMSAAENDTELEPLACEQSRSEKAGAISKPSRARQVPYRRVVVPPTKVEIVREQLLGHLPGGQELDEYEIGERPMWQGHGHHA